MTGTASEIIQWLMLQDRDQIFDIDVHREKRSLTANGMLWACIGDIAKAMKPPLDKWEVYLMMLKRYGKYTYICVKPSAVETFKKTWRECEELGEIEINGSKAVQLLAYFGSSTYDSKEFSELLDGVISEMVQMGLQPPPSSEMRRLIEQMEKQEQRRREKENESRD